MQNCGFLYWNCLFLRFSTLRFSKKTNEFLSSFVHKIAPGMGINAHCGADVRVSTDLLDRLEVHADFCQSADIAVAEDVRCRAVEVDLLIDAAQDPACYHLRDRLIVPDDVASWLERFQQLNQLILQMDDELAAFALWR